MQCVVEIGRPKADAKDTVRATASSAQYPREGVILAILTPRARMMLTDGERLGRGQRWELY